MDQLTVLETFAGIGCFGRGLESTGGFKIAAQVEWDRCSQLVLKKRFPGTPILPDVREVVYRDCIGTWEDPQAEYKAVCTKSMSRIIPGTIDVITSSFPCQQISVAGKGEGLINEEGQPTAKSGLWFETFRLIKEIRPKYAIIENVANLRSRGLSVILKGLRSIGYDAEWHIIPARAVGAPHLRERIWIIAYPHRPEVRHLPEWNAGGWERVLQRERQAFTGDDGQGGDFGAIRSGSSSSRGEGRTRNGECANLPTHPSCSRLWGTFASQEEASRWWTEAAAQVGHRWKTGPGFRGVDDGPRAGLDRCNLEPFIEAWLANVLNGVERDFYKKPKDDSIEAWLERYRRTQVRQLGNALVWQIPHLLGRLIMRLEGME